MAKIPAIDVFPSIREISTDASGDLQEIISAPAVTATLEYDAIDPVNFSAAVTGLAGNDVSITITENTGNDNEVVVTGNDVDVRFRETFATAVAGTKANVVYNGNITLEAMDVGVSSIQFSVIDNVDTGTATPSESAELTRSDNLTFTAVTAGVAGNNITIEITESNGAADAVSVTASAIKVDLDTAIGDYVTQDIQDLISNDPTASALISVTGGDASEAAAITSGAVSLIGGADASLGDDIVKVHPTDNDISVCLVDDYGNYDNDAIFTLLTDATKAWTASVSAVVTVSQSGASSVAAITGSFDLTGGSDPSGQTATTDEIVSLLTASEAASALVVATGGSSTRLPQVLAKSPLTGGVDATTSDLDADSEYIMIKKSDIHELEDRTDGSSEVDDARKIVWGVLDTYTSHVTGLSVEQQPENFLINRGQPALVIDGSGTRIRQAYSVQAFYATGDFDLEDETSV
jgi:hypothetical protein